MECKERKMWGIKSEQPQDCILKLHKLNLSLQITLCPPTLIKIIEVGRLPVGVSAKMMTISGINIDAFEVRCRVGRNCCQVIDSGVIGIAANPCCIYVDTISINVIHKNTVGLKAYHAVIMAGVTLAAA